MTSLLPNCQPGEPGQALVHEQEQGGQPDEVRHGLGISPGRIRYRPNEQEHLDERQDWDNQEAGAWAGRHLLVLKVTS